MKEGREAEGFRHTINNKEECPRGQEWYLERIEQIKSGDEGARNELLTELYSFVKRMVYRAVREDQLPIGEGLEDIAQAAIIKVSNGLLKYRSRDGALFTTWVGTIIKNCIIDYVRRGVTSKEKVESFNTNPLGDEPPSAIDRVQDTQSVDYLKELIKGERHKIFLLALGCLPPRQQEVAKCMYLEELSYGQTAKKLCISVGTVKAHLHRAAQSIKSYFETHWKE